MPERAIVVDRRKDMREWQKFENECCEYLNNTYGTNNINFVCDGGSDSNSPDIRGYIDGVNKFNIEVKSTSAQSGQFVVLNQDNRFVFSPRNKSSAEEADVFLRYMNDNYDRFSTATTSGVNLDIDINDSNKWIIGHYLKKNSRFVITRDDNGFVVLPTEKYGEYFETTCKYRIKKSGSSDVSPRDADKVKELFGAQSYKYVNGKKLYIEADSYSIKAKKSLDGFDYFISEKLDGGYLYIRKLSNTRNANVIFSIKLKKKQDLSDLDLFKEAL